MKGELTKVPELDIALFNGKQDLLCLYELCRGVALGQIDQKYLHKKLPDISTVRSQYINWDSKLLTLLYLILS